MRLNHVVVGDRGAIHFVAALLPRSKSDPLGGVWNGEMAAIAIVGPNTPRIFVHDWLHSTRADREHGRGSISPDCKLLRGLKFEYYTFKGRLIFGMGDSNAVILQSQ
jgi:hypothetical protein